MCFVVEAAHGNHPPRFLIDGQTEIVLRLKEGAATPVGKYIYVSFFRSGLCVFSIVGACIRVFRYPTGKNIEHSIIASVEAVQ
jgi:hypothetical protein